MSDTRELDRYLPEKLRLHIEQCYYARINVQASLDSAIHDPEFVHDPVHHIALFSDHGVMHVKDVAHQIINVLDTINGVLIPARGSAVLDFFMKGYGVMAAYLHDIGMVDFSKFGRTMHPEFATQTVFTPEFDDIIDVIWSENSGNIAWRLLNLASQGVLHQEPKNVLREILSMSNCHSKTKVPVEVLNRPSLLRQKMLTTLTTDLRVLYHQQRVEKFRSLLMTSPPVQQTESSINSLSRSLSEAETELENCLKSVIPASNMRHILAHYYSDVESEAFQWLQSDHPAMIDLINDVVDTLRALRCADALRQRGTTLKTSGNFQIFVDQKTANAVYALWNGERELYLLEEPDILASGEANLASSELGRDGNLRISFHRGTFADHETVLHAAYCVAVVVNDIQSDVVTSFKPSAAVYEECAKSIKTDKDILILLESTDDNLDFADLVATQLCRMSPHLRSQVKTVPSLQHASSQELTIYLNAPAYDGDIESKRLLLEQIAQSGHKIDGIDLDTGFEHVKLIALRAGDTLMEAGSFASFVYIPLGEGLRVIPLGGYQPFSVQAWVPLGNTGVIRGSIRNARVITEQDIQLLMIPKEIYLRYWHHTYNTSELLEKLRPVSH